MSSQTILLPSLKHCSWNIFDGVTFFIDLPKIQILDIFSTTTFQCQDLMKSLKFTYYYFWFLGVHNPTCRLLWRNHFWHWIWRTNPNFADLLDQLLGRKIWRSSLFCPYRHTWQQFIEVLKSLNLVGFKVILSVTDGHRTNVKFYTELCGSLLRVSIPHPIEAGSRLFLLFDPVHLMKNFYNNFQRKR